MLHDFFHALILVLKSPSHEQLFVEVWRARGSGREMLKAKPQLRGGKDVN